MNIFSTEYSKQQIKLFGAPEYNKDGIKVYYRNLQGRVDDFLSVNFRAGENAMDVPIFTIDGSLWMSVTPMEIQSHVLPLRKAKGKVATGGLGLGYFTTLAMMKKEVESIDVYETEQRVIDFYKEAFGDRPGFEKLNFIVGDMRKTMVGKTYDFLYIDIYQTLCPDETIEDFDFFQDENHIDEYHFWGQELPLAIICDNGGYMPEAFGEEFEFFYSEYENHDGLRLRDLDDEYCYNVAEKFLFYRNLRIMNEQSITTPTEAIV